MLTIVCLTKVKKMRYKKDVKDVKDGITTTTWDSEDCLDILESLPVNSSNTYIKELITLIRSSIANKTFHIETKEKI